MLTVIYSWNQVTELKLDLQRRKIFAENVNYIVRHIVSRYVRHLLRRPRYSFKSFFSFSKYSTDDLFNESPLIISSVQLSLKTCKG